MQTSEPPVAVRSRAAHAVRALETLGRGALAGVLAATTLGALDAAFDPHASWVRVLGRWIPIVSAAGGLFGVALSMLGWVASPLAARLSKRLRLGRFVSGDPAADRSPVHALHATVIALIVFVGAAFGASLSVSILVRRVQIESFAETLHVVGAVGAAVLALLVFLVVRSLATPLARWVDEKVGLPRPRSRGLSLFLYVAVPIVVAGELARRFATDLGALGPLFVCGMFFALWLVVAALVDSLARSRQLAIAFEAMGVVLAMAAFAWGARVPDDTRLRSIERGETSAVALSALRAVTDVDRDGSSSLFGGGDCAPWRSGIGPRIEEIPRNGIDENCDGKDGVSTVSASVVFYDSIDADLVHRRNVVWVIIDAVRADHVKTFGYERETTPSIDQLAESSLVFENAYSQSSATMFSIPSMLAGVDAGRIRWDIENTRAQPDSLLFGDRLRREGYTTAFIGTRYFPGFLPRLVASFDDVRVAANGQREGANDSAALATQVIEDAHADGRPFFLTLYFAAPHLPYVRHDGAYPNFGGGQSGLYDGEIAYADRHLGFVLDVLRQRKEVWDDTVIIVTSDHGEELGEHGSKGHAQTCHEESTHVPLVVRIPGVDHARVKHPVALTDVVPTLIEVLGLPRDDASNLNGKSLLATRFEASSPDRPISCAIIRQSKGGPREFRRSIRLGKWIYYEELFPHPAKMLFDTSSDPFEDRPLDPQGPDHGVADDLEDLADGYFTGNMSSLGFYDE